MHPRRVTEPHEAQECLAEVATSGLPLRECALRHGVAHPPSRRASPSRSCTTTPPNRAGSVQQGRPST
jgi:hypothetical protein